MKNFKFKLFCIAAILFLTVSAEAQFSAGFGWVMPRESPAATMEQTVGVTEITIKYHRPTVKGRVIWGCQTNDVLQKPGAVYPCLVPNGQVWRADANDATTVSFSTDVKIEGQPLPAGTYGLFMIPGESEWTIIFNKRAKQWDAFTYKDAEDALRVKVAPTAAQPLERLEYDFPAVSNDAAQIALRWEKLKVVFNVAVDSAKQSSAKGKPLLTHFRAILPPIIFIKTKSTSKKA